MTDTAPEVLPDNQVWIVMRHETTGGLARVTKSAFNAAHRKKGWHRVTEDNADVETLTKALEVLGVDFEHLGEEPSKQDLAALLNPDLNDAPAPTTTAAATAPTPAPSSASSGTGSGSGAGTGA